MNSELIASDIRSIYRSDPERAPEVIKLYLERQLSGLERAEKASTLRHVMADFRPGHATCGQWADRGSGEVWNEIAGLLLGREISDSEMDSPEVMEKLAAALNALFESLNDVMGVINRTLTGNEEQFATIRQVIGRSIRGENEPLDDYLRKIKEVFLVCHKAFQLAAGSKMEQVLSEFNPERIKGELGGGLKFGPLRKAELYDIFCERFKKCEQWFRSGRFNEELLREFEKRCQYLLTEKGLSI